jgi:hypothetical protein
METTIAPVPSHEPTIVTEAGRSWMQVSQNDESVPGARYRLRMKVKAPYTPGNIERLEQALRFGTGVRNVAQGVGLREVISIERFEASFPKDGAQGTPIWEFSMVFTKKTYGSPLAVIIGITTALAMAAILCAVVGHTIEKEADTLKDLGTDTIFNPFFLVAAVIIVLAFSGRSLKSIGG